MFAHRQHWVFAALIFSACGREPANLAGDVESGEAGEVSSYSDAGSGAEGDDAVETGGSGDDDSGELHEPCDDVAEMGNPSFVVEASPPFEVQPDETGNDAIAYFAGCDFIAWTPAMRGGVLEFDCVGVDAISRSVAVTYDAPLEHPFTLFSDMSLSLHQQMSTEGAGMGVLRMSAADGRVMVFADHRLWWTQEGSLLEMLDWYKEHGATELQDARFITQCPPGPGLGELSSDHYEITLDTGLSDHAGEGKSVDDRDELLVDDAFFAHRHNLDSVPSLKLAYVQN